MTRQILNNGEFGSVVRSKINSNFEELYNTAENAIKFGVPADGVTDATAAIQALVNSGRSVFLPKASYRMVGQVVVPAGTHIYSSGAEILVDPAGNYLGAFRAAGNGVKIAGLTFVGNGVETASSEQGGNSQLGAAVRGYDVSVIDVVGCHFYEFVLPDTDGQAIVGFNKCSNILVADNFWGSDNAGGTDVNVNYRTGNCIITNNRSLSASDIFCQIASVGSATLVPGTQIASTSHHVVTGNIIIKNNGNVVPGGRHGILVHYNGGVAHATITDNILVNGIRHGIYLRGHNTVGGNTGPTIVSNNTIRYFGGESGVASVLPWGYGSGIKVEGVDSCVLTGNLIERSGYNTDNTLRTDEAAGIETIRATRNAIIADNHINDTHGVGIAITPSVSVTTGVTSLDKVAIRGNSVRNSTMGGIVVTTNGGSGTRPSQAVAITGNIVETSAENVAGIFVNLTALSAGCGESVIQGNTVLGVGAAAGRVGIAFNGSNAADAYGIFDNLLQNLSVGVGSYQSIASNGVVSVAYVTHRRVGSQIVIDRNKFVDCVASYFIQATGIGRLSAVGPGNVYLGTSPLPNRNTNTWNQVVVGRVYGYDAAGVPLLELTMNATPTAVEQYYRGDRIINHDPVAGGTAGWACTASGTPGTWKTFGTIEA